MQDSKKLGKNLKKAREKAGLTQQEVADQVGIHVNYYARIERGEEVAALETLRAIAKVLKVRVSDIIPF